MPESILQQARDVLDEWRAGATGDRWVPRLTDAVKESMRPGERVVAFGGYTDGDARLIVGTSGNPELLDEIDGLLAHAIRESYFELTLYGRLATRIATAIVAAEKRMNA
jgi:hypothetical protein